MNTNMTEFKCFSEIVVSFSLVKSSLSIGRVKQNCLLMLWIFLKIQSISYFQGMLKTLLEEKFPDNLEFVLRDPILFGDYRTALDEGEPRLYEDIQDYDAAKALFQEVSEKKKMHYHIYCVYHRYWRFCSSKPGREKIFFLFIPFTPVVPKIDLQFRQYPLKKIKFPRGECLTMRKKGVGFNMC